MLLLRRRLTLRRLALLPGPAAAPSAVLLVLGLVLLLARRWLPETLFRAMIRMSLSEKAFNSVGKLLYKS